MRKLPTNDEVHIEGVVGAFWSVLNFVFGTSLVLLLGSGVIYGIFFPELRAPTMSDLTVPFGIAFSGLILSHIGSYATTGWERRKKYERESHRRIGS